MKTCKTCLFFDVRESRKDGMCLFLGQPKFVTHMEAYLIGNDVESAHCFYVEDNFGCVHHKEKYQLTEKLHPYQKRIIAKAHKNGVKKK